MSEFKFDWIYQMPEIDALHLLNCVKNVEVAKKNIGDPMARLEKLYVIKTGREMYLGSYGKMMCQEEKEFWDFLLGLKKIES